jgi:hypothetical protein
MEKRWTGCLIAQKLTKKGPKKDPPKKIGCSVARNRTGRMLFALVKNKGLKKGEKRTGCFIAQK